MGEVGREIVPAAVDISRTAAELHGVAQARTGDMRSKGNTASFTQAVMRQLDV